MKNLLKKQNGITLIALVFTVIIMLILVTVSISVLTMDRGLFNRTQAIINVYENASKSEAEMINNIMDELKKYDNIIYIYTKEELEEFRDNVNTGNTYKGVTVKLMNNIDLEGNENDESTWWDPIGSQIDKKMFEGIFDGNNYEINGIYNKTESSNEAIGFFSEINNATIKNLSLSGDIILGENNDDTNLSGAGFVGCARGSSLILNCINRVNVTKNSSGRDTAGFVGAVGNTMISNIPEYLIVKNCINYGKITGANNCGGIIGNVDNGNVIIEDTYNMGDITNYIGNYAGGLIARDALETCSITIKNSYNKGTIKARRGIGGLVARVHGNITIDNSYNNAELYSEQRSGTAYIGGLIGLVIKNTSRCTITNSYNDSQIIIVDGEYNSKVGGLIGETRAAETHIINCYNSGNILGASYTSGLCGIISTSGEISIINCYNAAKLSGEYIGGIAMFYSIPNNSNIDNVYYINNIISTGILKYPNRDINIEDNTIGIAEEQIKTQDFVNKLNSKLLDIDSQYDLRRWKFVEENYPVFE